MLHGVNSALTFGSNSAVHANDPLILARSKCIQTRLSRWMSNLLRDKVLVYQSRSGSFSFCSRIAVCWTMDIHHFNNCARPRPRGFKWKKRFLLRMLIVNLLLIQPGRAAGSEVASEEEISYDDSSGEGKVPSCIVSVPGSQVDCLSSCCVCGW